MKSSKPKKENNKKKIDKEKLREDVKATIAKYRKTFERLS